MNTFGNHIRLTTFGESHGQVIGGVLDGIPAGFTIRFDEIDQFIKRRKPEQIYGGTPRKETDQVNFVSGILEGKTTGAPLAFIVENKQQKTSDYEHLKNINRPSHADYVYREKYGIYDHSGGGRASARETLVRVIAGSIAAQMLSDGGMQFHTFISQIGNIQTQVSNDFLPEQDRKLFPDNKAAENMLQLIQKLQAESDSIGGIIQCRVKGLPVGLGAPVYNKLNSALAAAMFSINAVKGFEIGRGFQAAQMQGSQYNDQMTVKDGQPKFLTNNDGGVQAGISNGNMLQFNVAFKPPSSIGKNQSTVNLQNQQQNITITGRHDSCIVPRAAVVVEAMAALVLLDFYIDSQHDLWKNCKSDNC